MKLKFLYDNLINKANSLGYNKIVLGNGNTNNPPVMLIGEAPGKQEEEQGKPFVGKAGKNLTEFLNAINLNREDIYISNLVKQRPTKLSKAGNTVNRSPNKEEIEFFTPFLLEEISIIKPKIIVTLGNYSLNAFVKSTIGLEHGKMQTISIHNTQYKLFPLYHPAATIYNRELVNTYLSDIKKLYDYVKIHW